MQIVLYYRSCAHNRLLTLQCPWPLLHDFLRPGPSCWLQDFRCIYYIVGAVLLRPFDVLLDAPTRAAVVWCTRQSEGVWVGRKKTGESFNISAGLQRTAEGLECFQMALQQKTGSCWQESPSQSVPASNMQAQTTELGCIYSSFPLNEVKCSSWCREYKDSVTFCSAVEWHIIQRTRVGKIKTKKN